MSAPRRRRARRAPLALAAALVAPAAALAAPSAALVALAAPTAALAAVPVAEFGFEEGAGALAADASGNGHTGVVTGATWTTTGRHGGALCFDGVDDWVTVADRPELDFFGRLTLMAWVRPDSLAGWSTVLLKERPRSGSIAPGLAYALYASDDTGRPPAGYVHNGADRAAAGAAPLPLGTWSHLAVTYDGAGLSLYVDGVRVRRRAVSGGVHATTGPLRLGGNAVWNEFFRGCLDDVRVYAVALDAAEIAAAAATPIGDCADGRFGPTCAGACDCAAAGTCNDGALGDGACVCRPGFGGERCERCADGFFGPRCEGRCDCARGACDDGLTGDGVCRCQGGFTGERCDTCEPGHFGPDCAPCACEHGGRCAEGLGGTGACRCRPGFDGASCERCAPGHFGADCAPCDCGAGTCDEGLGGTGACGCPPGFTGAACERCEPGRFGPACEGTCDCGPGGTCREGLGGDGGCDCAPSYHGDACELRCGDGALDPGEGCDDGNRSAGDGCDPACGVEPGSVGCRPGDPSCGLELPRPKSCLLADAAYCAEFTAQTLAQFSAFVAARGGSDASVECYGYSESVCRGCRLPTLEQCADPPAGAAPPGSGLCLFGSYLQCGLLFEQVCPEATLARCASPSFYAQAPLTFGSVPECRDRVQASCDALFRSQCPSAASLDACAPLLADLDAISPTQCRDYVERRCDATVANLCAPPSIELCAALEQDPAVAHPACGPGLQAGCAGWAERLCPDAIAFEIDATTCTTQLDLLTRASVPAPCALWVEQVCVDLAGEIAQAQFDAGNAEGQPGCRTTTVVETGAYAYDVQASVSDKNDFDCTPVEVAPEPPHDQVFELTPLEAVLVAFPVATLQRDIGGETIQSCEEYVAQKYWDYSAFKAFTSLFAEDTRRVFQAAYSTDARYEPYAIGARALLAWQTDGNNPFGGFPNRQPTLQPPAYLGSRNGYRNDDKNDFVALTYPLNAEVRALLLDYAFWTPAFLPSPFEIDAQNARRAALLDRLVPLQDYWDRGAGFGDDDGWHWHLRMSEAMRDQGIGDEELNYLHQRRQRFPELLATVRATLALRAQLGTGPAHAARVAQLTLSLRAYLQELAELLDDADTRGCFDDRRDPSGGLWPAPCDWAPADFAADVDRQFESRMRADRQRCERLAPADFASLSLGYTFFYVSPTGQVLEGRITQDPRLSLYTFEPYLDRMQASGGLQAFFFAQIPPERAPSYGQSYGDGAEVGKRKYFSAGYDYGAAWGLHVPEDPTNVCKLNGDAEAHLDVFLYLANRRIDIIDAGVTADTATVVFETHLNVLGVPLWQAGSVEPGPERPELDYDYNLVFDAASAEVSKGQSISVPIFSIAGFDIDLTAGYAGRLGIDVDGQMTLGVNLDAGECAAGMDFDLGVRATPFLALSGFLELGIDLFIVEIGVGGELTIIDVRVPTNLVVGATADATTSSFDASLHVAADSKVVISTLGGRVYVYAKTWFDTYKKTFFRWKGKRWELALFDKEFTLGLGRTQQYCASHPCD